MENLLVTELIKECHNMGKFRTSDNDKKAHDNNAEHELKNQLTEENRQKGKNQFSKKTDHL